jgi:hypothetical protein
MTEPRHDLGHALHPLALGEFRPRDHDHGQGQHPGCVDLGARAVAARIAGDDPGDTSRAHHFQLALKRERPTRHDDVRGEGPRRFGRINESQRIGVLRLGREWCDVLAADGEEYVCRRVGQRGDGCVDICDLDPVVAGNLGPWRTLKSDQRRSGFRARLNRVAAHPGREGVRRIDHMRDAFTANVVSKSADAAKTADAGRQRLIGRCTGAAAIGIDGIDACARDLRRKQACIGRSAQNERARHG